MYHHTLLITSFFFLFFSVLYTQHTCPCGNTLPFPRPPQGGIAFILIKGVLKVYYKQQKYIVQAKRKILNYPDRNGEPHNNTGDEDTEDSGNE